MSFLTIRPNRLLDLRPLELIVETVGPTRWTGPGPSSKIIEPVQWTSPTSSPMVQAGTIGSLEFFLDEGSNRLLNRRYHGDSDVKGAMWSIRGLQESYIK